MFLFIKYVRFFLFFEIVFFFVKLIKNVFIYKLFFHILSLIFSIISVGWGSGCLKRKVACLTIFSFLLMVFFELWGKGV